MKSFRAKYPNLSEEQLQVKYKIWQREKEREEELLEALKRKIPFREDDGDEDTGSYGDSFGGDFGNGVISDAVLSGALITFVYNDGTTKTSYSDGEGKFDIPEDFSSGDIITSGGFDVVTGIPFIGEFNIDAEFFFKYRVITPFTHLANHIWLNTPTRTPQQAMEMVVNHFPDFIGLPILGEIDLDKIFNDDHVKLTLEGVYGAKEVQAINTLIEIHSDLISNTEAFKADDVYSLKQKAYRSIANALLVKVNRQTNGNYFDSVFDFHDVVVDKKYKDCCMDLISKASKIIYESMDMDDSEATTNLQALNLAIKSEWSQKAFEMTSNPGATKNSVWNSIDSKSTKSLLSNINLPQI